MAAIDHASNRLVLRTQKLDFLYSFVTTDVVRLADGVVSVPYNDVVFSALWRYGVKNLDGLDPILNRDWLWPSVNGQPLRQDQKETAAFLVRCQRGFCLHPPRMGKTASVISAARYMQKTGLVKSVLIVAVLSAFHDWRRHLFSMASGQRVVELHGRNRDLVYRIGEDRAPFYVVNPEGLKIIAAPLRRAVEGQLIDLIVFDELTEYATCSTAKWKAAFDVSRRANHVWGLTGTPGNPFQAHGQIRLIRPEAPIPSSFHGWRNTVAREVRKYKWVFLPTAFQLVDSLMRPAIRFRKEDVFSGLNPIVEFIDVPMSRAQEVAYRDIQNRGILQYQNGETMTTAAAAVVSTKLLQISAGTMLDGDSIVDFDMTERLDVLWHIITMKSETKTIVFASFVEVMERLREELTARLGPLGQRVEVVNGATSLKDRGRIVSEFQQADSPLRVLVLHPKVARYSLELSAADTCVFWGPCLSGAYTYEQCRNRILSGLQKSRTPAILHIQSSEAERRLHRAVLDGRQVQRELADMFLSSLSDRSKHEATGFVDGSGPGRLTS